MDPSIAPIAQIFGISPALYDQALAGLDRKTLLRRPGAPVGDRRPPGLQSIWPSRGQKQGSGIVIKYLLTKVVSDLSITFLKKCKCCAKESWGRIFILD